MAHASEKYLQHVARRHHAAMKKLDGMRDKFDMHSGRLVGTIETGAGAWFAGLVEGKLSTRALPLVLGVGTLALGHLDWPGGPRTDDVMSVGNGLVSSFFAGAGYSFGSRWKATGKVFGAP